MNNIAHKIDTTQAHQDGEFLNMDSLNTYVLSLIHSNAKYRDGRFQLRITDVPRNDRIIFLSRISSAEDYEYYMQSDSMIRAALREHAGQMQGLIDARLPQAWEQVQDEIDLWKHGNRPFGNEVMMLPDGNVSDYHADIYRY